MKLIILIFTKLMWRDSAGGRSEYKGIDVLDLYVAY